LNNLGILAAFKYFDFFSREFAAMLSSLGFDAQPVVLEMSLPVCISCYIFQGDLAMLTTKGPGLPAPVTIPGMRALGSDG
jgi:hypothetical protein